MLAISTTSRYQLALCVLFFIAAALLSAQCIAPYIDEGALFSPGRNLILHGHMGTSILDTTSELREGMSMRGMDRYTYQVMPLYLVTQAAWYKIVGFGLMQMRALSTLFGVAALLAWYVVFSKLFENSKAAMLAVALIATDNVFVFGGAFGRTDMMSCSLATIGIACYLYCREENLGRAVFLSQCFEAASLFTHPAGLTGVVAVVVLALYLDRKRLRLGHLFLVPVPYLTIAFLWGLYILQDPQLFVEQFTTSAANRFGGLTQPWIAVWHEVHDRYLEEFGFRAGDGLASRMKIILLLLYVGGPILVYATAALRSLKGVRALLLIVITNFLIFTILEGTKQQFYLVHVLPLMEGLLALWVFHWWQARSGYRWALAGLMVLFFGLHLLRIVSVYQRDRLHTEFTAVVDYLKQNTTSTQLIMGPCELAFGLGFDSNLVDDHRLGFFSGKKPDVIVVDSRYRQWIERMRVYKPEIFVFVNRLFDEQFVKRYDQNSFQVYFRTAH